MQPNANLVPRPLRPTGVLSQRNNKKFTGKTRSDASPKRNYNTFCTSTYLNFPTAGHCLEPELVAQKPYNAARLLKAGSIVRKKIINILNISKIQNNVILDNYNEISPNFFSDALNFLGGKNKLKKYQLYGKLQ